MRSFSELDSRLFTENLVEQIKGEIEGSTKEYILGVDEETFKKYLVDKYAFEELMVDFEKEDIGFPYVTKEYVEGRFEERYKVDAYYFTVNYPFTGSAIFFRIKPSRFILTSNDIDVNVKTMTVSFTFKMLVQDPIEFNRMKSQIQRNAFANLDNANNEIRLWNNRLPEIVNSAFQIQKNKYLKENNFFAAINIKVNKDTESVFTAPTIKKILIPQPTVSKNKEFSSEPILATEVYNDILKVIYDSGKSMEKKPSLHKDKDEEGLRDVFLHVLETRYEATTATGETFNRGGKTDIILKYANDGSNLFVAECKFWHGAGEFQKAISQLFDGYLTWRDSKAALIMFVRNKDFTNVLQTIKTEAKKHPLFLKESGNRGESSFSYLFCLPQDKNKHVYFEILAFHYDK
jgi:hypothetical protein